MKPDEEEVEEEAKESKLPLKFKLFVVTSFFLVVFGFLDHKTSQPRDEQKSKPKK